MTHTRNVLFVVVVGDVYVGLFWVCVEVSPCVARPLDSFRCFCRSFPQVDPPSRACVQVPLPNGCPVLLDVLLCRPAGGRPTTPADGGVVSLEVSGISNVASMGVTDHVYKRSVLHVQSISSWAPSCIGPYSQVSVFVSMNEIIVQYNQASHAPSDATLPGQCVPRPAVPCRADPPAAQQHDDQRWRGHQGTDAEVG